MGAHRQAVRVDGDVARLDGGIGPERHGRAVQQRVGVRAGERERGVREPGREPGLGRTKCSQIVRRKTHDDPVRNDGALPVADPVRLHGALDPALDLDRAEPGPEESGGLALEEPFEKPLDGGKGSHVGGGV